MQQKAQTRLSLALLFTALAVLAYFATSVISDPIDFMFRNAAGLSTARSIAQILILLAVIALFVSGLIIAVPTALQPGNWLRKVLYVLPIYMLGFTLVGIVSTQLLGVGTVGIFFNLNGVGPVMLATVWLALGAILSVITVVIAAARVNLSSSTARAGIIVAAVASVLSILAAIAMLASVAIVATSTPSGFGGGGGFPPRNNGAQGQTRQRGGTATVQSTVEAPSSGLPAGQNQSVVPGQAQSTAEAPSGFAPQNGRVAAPESTAEAPSGFALGASAQNSSGGQAQPTAQVGGGSSTGRGSQQFPQGNDGRPGGDGNFPGGPGGGSANVARNYEIGGALMAIFAVLGVAGTMIALRARTSVMAAQTSPTVRTNLPREVGMAILSGVGLTVVLVVLMQIPPVSRTNPPVQMTINWDTAQTQDLAARACMNCHSNETTWPWYAYVAPASWLTVMHVTDARQQMNLSQLNTLPSFRKSMMAEEIAMQIRSGAMPPKDYLLLHPEARLTDTEKQELISGFQASLAGS